MIESPQGEVNMSPLDTRTIAIEPVVVDAEGVSLPGDLSVPSRAPGIVLFAHGSGSSRRSPRNRFVADVLTESGLGTLLFDLLTPGEERNRENVFDIGLLARRLGAATRWLRTLPIAQNRALGYFGASTGAGAALEAAARSEVPISAVVSRGGRPDLAGEWLPKVTAPTLLIVGGHDGTVLALNREAFERLRCPKRLEVVAGATHLFEEPGTLEAAARLAKDWFARHLTEMAGP
jgi:putative phosphoribosyl transferase